jgi:RHS repeat-associated protein
MRLETKIDSLYDASGSRVARGKPAKATLPLTLQACNMATNGFTATNEYLLDQGGDQVTELNTSSGTMAWAHSNVWAGSHLDATYDTKGLHFHLADPLGTRRIQTNIDGAVEYSFQSLPFGDNFASLPTALATSEGIVDATENHFTGKERDTESGNDYFMARYYSSAMGRFMSPDWSAKVMPVPYAKLDDPQSLNLYAYVGNNPLTRVDADGHDVIFRGNETQRNEEFARNTSTLNSGEKALVSSQKGKDGQYHLRIDPKAAAAYKGAHTNTFKFMAQAVKSPHTIGVQMAETATVNGKTINVASQAGGGLTLTPVGSRDSEVYLSEGGHPGGTVSGVPATPGIVAEHETYGHARLAALGLPHGEPQAVGAENQMRQDVLMAPRPVPAQ